MPAPAEAAVEPGRPGEGDRVVVEEGERAGAVDGLAVLGEREVVDELVVVPVAVEAGAAAQVAEMPEAEVLPVLRPLGRDRQRRRHAADLAVGIDRVAEVDVEVVLLCGHPPVDLEEVVGGLAGLRVAGAVGVAADREADGRVRGRGRRRPEGAARRDLAVLVRRREQIRVARARLQAVDAVLDDAVVGVRRLQRDLDGWHALPRRRPDVELDAPELVRARPQRRTRRGHLPRGDAVPEPRRRAGRGRERQPDHGQPQEDAAHRRHPSAPARADRGSQAAMSTSRFARMMKTVKTTVIPISSG